MVPSWRRHATAYLNGPTGYTIVIVVIGIYFALYTLMQVRYDWQLNRATLERSAFIDQVTSGHRGAFVAAMKTFGPVQMMRVPKTPRLWQPWQWFDGWGQPNRPNFTPLYKWARHTSPLCTPERCGVPEKEASKQAERAIVIDLRGSNLQGAYLYSLDLRQVVLGRDPSNFSWYSEGYNRNFVIATDLREAVLVGSNLSGVNLAEARLRGADLRVTDLSGANLWRANLREARLRGANLSHANLRNAFFEGADLRSVNLDGADLTRVDLTEANLLNIKWNDHTIWPEGFTPPPSRPAGLKPCVTPESDAACRKAAPACRGLPRLKSEDRRHPQSQSGLLHHRRAPDPLRHSGTPVVSLAATRWPLLAPAPQAKAAP